MAHVLMLSSADPAETLPALALLGHRVRHIAAEPAALVAAPECDIVLLDARTDLAGARSLCSVLTATGMTVPLIAVVTEGGLSAVNGEWGISDVVLVTAGPAEVEARIRIALTRKPDEPAMIQASGLTIDEASYSAKLRGRTLDLTFKEFELLRFLAGHPSRVFTREQLLSEVWGYDYFGGTRTVDVHVRRLRAKLGDLDSLIGTVRNVGYRFMIEEDNDRLAPPLRS